MLNRNYVFIMAKEDTSKKEESSLEESSTIIQPSAEPSKNDDKTSDTPIEEEQSLNSNAESDEKNENKLPKKHYSKIFANLYLLIFFVVLLVSAGIVYIAVKTTNKNQSNQPQKVQTLTDKQLTALKGSTTLVGDPQRILDIQGSSIFEGQVLMRNNLDVAGSIKVGGSLSLPAITVGGKSSFGQIQVNDKLSVNGNTSLQGQLTIEKGLTVAGNASFGSLSASQLNINNLHLSGDLVITRHISITGGTPSRSGGGAIGSGGTASVNGSDTAGTVTINTGSSPSAGCLINVAFTQRYNSTPHLVISPSNSRAGTLSYYANRTNLGFSICTNNTPAASSTFLFDYIAID
jgi:cytoskeletal protein CcmA (bactofilin family)